MADNLKNFRLNNLFTGIVFLLLPLLSANAQELLVIDQQGMPVADAIVSIDSSGKQDALPQDLPIAVMDQINKQFVPHVLVVQKGQSVSFPNSDNIRHHVYSFSSPKTFELKLYSGTPTEPLIFDKSGIVVLGCNIHDSMVGYIYVADTSEVAKTSKDGIAQFDKVPEQVYIWHEKVKGQKWTKRSLAPTLNSEKNLWEVVLPLESAPKTGKSSGFKSGFQKRN